MVMNNIITFDNITAFIRKAMKKTLEIEYVDITMGTEYFQIKNKNDCCIRFLFYQDNIRIFGFNKEDYELEYQLSEREKIELENLKLDIKEYNEKRALILFTNFFNEDNTEVTINDLDSEDD